MRNWGRNYSSAHERQSGKGMTMCWLWAQGIGGVREDIKGNSFGLMEEKNAKQQGSLRRLLWSVVNSVIQKAVRD